MKDCINDFSYNSERWLSLEDFEGEEWKDIPGYEGWYMVSNYGRIKSVERSTIQKRVCDKAIRLRTYKSCIIKASNYGSYLICHLKKNGTSKVVKYHRIVCSVFNENPNNLPQINHKNEIKTDNRAENLEWCTPLYNRNYGTAQQRLVEKLKNNPYVSRPVYKYSINGVFIEKYPSIIEAYRRTGVKPSNITSVCNGGRSATAGGYIWSFSGNNDDVMKSVLRKQSNKKLYEKKRVLMFSMNHKLLNTFNSIIEASKETGIHKDTISRCCKHYGYYKSAGGYKWEFA